MKLFLQRAKLIRESLDTIVALASNFLLLTDLEARNGESSILISETPFVQRNFYLSLLEIVR